jgi:hypothetical protein
MFGSANLLEELARHMDLGDLPALAATSPAVWSSLPAPLLNVLPVLGALREPWIDLVWIAVLGGRVERLRWLLQQSAAAAAERPV